MNKQMRESKGYQTGRIVASAIIAILIFVAAIT